MFSRHLIPTQSTRTVLLLLTALLLGGAPVAQAQLDSLILSNGDVMVGEVKTLTRGVLTVSTDYSDSDFKIEWSGVKEIYLRNYFLITLTGGRVVNGRLETSAPDEVTITDQYNNRTKEPKEMVVYLDEIDIGFWSRLSASIDLGYSFTKANNVNQFNSRTFLAYKAERWNASLTYNGTSTNQDSVEKVQRDEVLSNFRYILPRNYYFTVAQNFLSNTEQKLDLRSTSKIGIGHYFVRTNTAYWALEAGGAFVAERFATAESGDDRETWETYVGTGVNLFDIGDLSFKTDLTVYPSITARERVRVDLGSDVKYDLPKDFYIRVGISLNFDNRPVADAAKTDYVFQTSIGWEL